VCLPGFLGLQFEAQFRGDKSAVKAFVDGVMDATDGPIGDDPLAWWRAQWKAKHGTVTGASGKPTLGQKAVDAANAYLASQGIAVAPKPTAMSTRPLRQISRAD